MNSSVIIHTSAFPEGLSFATQDHSWCAFIGETTAPVVTRQLRGSVRSVTEDKASCLHRTRNSLETIYQLLPIQPFKHQKHRISLDASAAGKFFSRGV
jgi:hypothetical protein